ncbi:PAB-dependent poly(A)-specific ribonuclease subunit 3 [Tilletia horrida]|uniref:PAN2-PAN3 deadenylation complex subunit PAN3 n=1 Tax=Tilletia horrida TaxID=155126 RepID=A0AAN6GKG2_9BASI|nr:PAB-dependent poly(A)-specific ribonuclease subunit 3 [Tilletia horrida]
MTSASSLLCPRPGSLRPVEDADEEIFHLFTSLKDQGKHGLGHTTLHNDRISIRVDFNGGSGHEEATVSKPTIKRARSHQEGQENVFRFPSGTVTVSAANDDEEEENGASTSDRSRKRDTRSLPSGKHSRKTGTSSGGAEGKRLHLSDTMEPIQIVLRQDHTSFRTVAGNTGSVAWRSSFALATILLRDLHFASQGRRDLVSLLNGEVLFPRAQSPSAIRRARPYTVLELGAGTGVLSSLVLAHPAFSRSASSTTTTTVAQLRWIATDQGEVFELLKRNVESTRSRWRVPASAVPHAGDERASLSARDLDWVSVLDLARRGDDASRRTLHKLRREIMAPHGNDGAQSDKLPPGSTMSSTDSDDADDASPDLILAVDCIFNPALFDALLATFSLFASGVPETQLMVAPVHPQPRMYGSGPSGSSGNHGGGAGLNFSAPDFAPAAHHQGPANRAIRIVNPDNAPSNSANASSPASPVRRPPSSTASNSAGAGPSGNNNSGGSGAPSRWSRAAAIPSFQPRDHQQGGSNQHYQQDPGAPPGLGPAAAAAAAAPISARNVAAPVFVPKQRAAGSSAPPGLSAPPASNPASASQGGYDYQHQRESGPFPGPSLMQQQQQQQHSSAGVNPYAPAAHQSPNMNPYALQHPGMSPHGAPPPALFGGPPGSMSAAMSMAGGAANLSYQPPLYHLYAPALPHISNLSPHHLALHSFFMSPTLREELQRKNEAIRAAPVPLPDTSGAEGGLGGGRPVKSLPEELHVYHSLIPLEPLGAGGAPIADVHPALAPGSASSEGGRGGAGAGGGLGFTSNATMSGEPSKVFGYRTHIYRAVCQLDGKTYALRRLEGFRLHHEAAIALVERWRRVRHPGVVCVREAFTTRAFGDSSIVFVSDYHPLATNLLQEYLHPKPPRIDPRTNRLQPVNMQIPERTFWSYIVQLTSALRAVHKAGLAVRYLEASKVLKTGKNRIRISGCSVFDVLQYDPAQPPQSSSAGALRLARQQSDDLYALGILILQLATNSISATTSAQAIQRSLELVMRNYSMELRDLCAWLLEARSSQGTNSRSGGHGADDVDNLRTVAQLEAILTGVAQTSATLGEGSSAFGLSSTSSLRSPLASAHGSDASGPSGGLGASGWRRNAQNTNKNAEGKDGSSSGVDKGPPNRCAEELDAALNWGDLLEGELMKETENARIVRLVCKLGLINERPEFDHDPRWSETGDRYIIKLFRDFVFHAVDPETGQPIVDLSYILTNLNKLDAGSDERIVLTSRDEQSCLVVSYRDVSMDTEGQM